MSEFRFDIRSQDQYSADLTRLQNELKRVTAELRSLDTYASQGVRGLSSAFKQIEGDQSRLIAQIEALRRAYAGFALQAQVSSNEMRRALQAAGELRSAHQVFSGYGPGRLSGFDGREIERAAGGMRGFGTAAGAAAGEVSLLERGMQRVIPLADELVSGRRRQAFATLGSAIRSGGFGGVGTTVAFGGLIGAGAVEGLQSLAVHYGELAERAEVGAAVAGTSAEQWQQFAGVMDIITGKTQSAERAIGILGEKLQEATSNPLSKARADFLSMGVTLDEMTNGLTHPLELLEILRQRFQAGLIPPALMREGLGRDFIEFLPYITRSADELDKLTAAMQRSSSVMSGSQRKGMEDAKDAVGEFNKSVEGLGESLTRLAESSGASQFAISWVQGFTNAINSLDQLEKKIDEFEQKRGKKLSDSLPDFTKGLPPAAQLGVAVAKGIHAAISASSENSAPARGKIPPLPTNPPELNMFDLPQQYGKTPGDYPFPHLGYSPKFPALGAATASQFQPQAEAELQRRIRAIQQETQLRSAEYDKQAAMAGRDLSLKARIEGQKTQYVAKQAQIEESIRQQYVQKANQLQMPELGEKLGEGGRGQVQAVEDSARAITARREAQEQSMRASMEEIRARMELSHDDQERMGFAMQLAQLEAKLTGGVQGQLIIAREINRQAEEHVRLLTKAAEAATRHGNVQERTSNVQIRTRQLPDPSFTYQQAYQIRIQAINEAGNAEIQAYQRVQAAAIAAYGAESTQALKARDDVVNATLDLQEKQTQAFEEFAAAAKKAAEATEKVFKDAFDSIGDGIAGIGSDLLKLEPSRHASRLQRSLDETINRTVGGLTKDLGTLGSQSIAQNFLGGKPGQGVGDILTGEIGKLLGITPQQAIQQATNAALIGNTVATTANTTATAAQSTTSGVSGIGGIFGGLGGFASLLKSIPLIGTLFSKGGVAGYYRGGVAYAAAGFVPHGPDTVPAMLTPGEPVLPISGPSSLQGVINAAMANGMAMAQGNMEVNHTSYNNITTQHPYQTRADFDGMLDAGRDAYRGAITSELSRMGYRV